MRAWITVGLFCTAWGVHVPSQQVSFNFGAIGVVTATPAVLGAQPEWIATPVDYGEDRLLRVSPEALALGQGTSIRLVRVQNEQITGRIAGFIDVVAADPNGFWVTSPDMKLLERRTWANERVSFFTLPLSVKQVFLVQRAGSPAYLSTDIQQLYVVQGNRLARIAPPRPSDRAAAIAVFPDGSLLAWVKRSSGEESLMRWGAGKWERIDPPGPRPRMLSVEAVSESHKFALVSEEGAETERAWRLSLSPLRWERLPNEAFELHAISDSGAFVGMRKGWLNNDPSRTPFYAISPTQTRAAWPWGSKSIPGLSVRAHQITAIGRDNSFLVYADDMNIYWVRPRIR